MKNLLSSAVNGGDLRRLNDNKTTGRTHKAFSDPRIRWGGDTFSLFFSSRDQRVPRCPCSELVPPFLDKSYAAGCVEDNGGV